MFLCSRPLGNRQNNSQPTLAGAGPGDPEPITHKGLKTIQEADVILHDALAYPDLMDYRKKDCRFAFVGKRAGLFKYSQKEINQLIVDNARPYGHVVRLKRGDPFIFSWGFEELEYASLRGLDVAAAAKRHFLNLSETGYCKIALLSCNNRALPEPRSTSFRLRSGRPPKVKFKHAKYFVNTT